MTTPGLRADQVADAFVSVPGVTLDILSGRATTARTYNVDAYADIDTWHRSGDVLELADLIVTSRPEVPLTGAIEPPIAARKACCYDPTIGCHVHSSGHSLRFHQLTTGLPVSASMVRACRRRGEDVRHLVGAPVAAYIERLRLYLETS